MNKNTKKTPNPETHPAHLIRYGQIFVIGGKYHCVECFNARGERARQGYMAVYVSGGEPNAQCQCGTYGRCNELE